MNDKALSESHSNLCSKITNNFNASKAQQPTGILDEATGDFKNYFVWAGGSVKDEADTSEPGTVLFQN